MTSAQAEQETLTFDSDLLPYLKADLLVKDSRAALTELQTLKALIAEQQNSAIPDWTPLQQSFNRLALDWKAVEAMYVAGDLDENFLDHPRFIDFYHQGNESIKDQVEMALASDQPLKQALFKNSSRGINGLEIILYSDAQLTGDAAVRRLQAAEIARANIEGWMYEIADFYESDTSFVKGGKASLSLLVNRLIDSSYKLANWRVGEAAGLTPKTKGSLNPSSLEFPYAQLSHASIERILNTHARVIKNDAALDLMSVGKLAGVGKDMAFLVTRIQAAQSALNAVPAPLVDQIETPEYKTLFNQLAMLQNAYYFMLINSLNLEARILDADGD
jgi:hypothetical protein